MNAKFSGVTLPCQGNHDIWVAKYNSSGAKVYSTYLGGTSTEYGRGIATDAAGSAFVVGSTASTNFPTLGPVQASHGGGSYDGFVSKLNASGSALIYSTYLGGVFTDDAQAIAIDSGGNAVVVGNTNSTNFPTIAPLQSSLASPGRSDAFLARLSATGGALLNSTYLGGTGDDSALGVAVYSASTAYLVGSTDSVDFPIVRPVSGQGSYHGNTDAFVAALDATGSSLSYSSYFGGAAEDHAVGVAHLRGTATVTLVGNTLSTDLPVVGAAISNLVGSQDGFVVKLPIASNPVPAGAPWNFLFLAGLLLGAGLFVSASPRKQAL